MATIGNTQLTLVDHARRMDPKGGVAKIAEILNEQNEILQDVPWIEGNLPTGHRSTIRTGLPTVYFRSINAGTPRSKSTTVQVDDACAEISGFSDIDEKIIELGGGGNEMRLSEDMPFMESMSQKFVDTLFYGNTATDPKSFLGIAPRFASTTEANGQNIIKADASPSGADNTSIFLVGWGPQTIAGIYPKGSKAGLKVENLGKETVLDSDNNPYRAYRTKFQWDCGLMMKDWRYVVRICNIDVSQLTKSGSTGSDLMDAMVQAVELLQNPNGCKPVFYCNRTVRGFLRRQIQNRSNIYLTHETVEGKKVTMFDGIPVRRCDALLNTESSVS